MTIRLSVQLDSFSYPDGTVALSGIHLDVARGEFCGILGANGSGKTTLLRIIAGLENPDAGQILFHGEDTTNRTARVTGFMPPLASVAATSARSRHSTCSEHCWKYSSSAASGSSVRMS